MKIKRVINLWLMVFGLSLISTISFGSSVWHDQHNNLLVNKEPFFPIGMYSVRSPTVFTELKRAGFNTVHSYEISKEYLCNYLLKAEDAGLKTYIYPATQMKDISYSLQKVASAVEEFRNSPALLAWQLVDEPELKKTISLSDVAQLYKMVDIVDGTHPSALVISKADKLEDYVPYTDIIIVDPYPIPDRPLTLVSDMIDKTILAVGDKKPVWAILQVFGYQDKQHKGWNRKREPTLAEVRCMTYLAIAHGAKGIFYFAYHGSQYDIRLSPKHWDGVKRIAGELRDLTPVLLAPKSKKKIGVKVDGGNQTTIHSLIKEWDGKTYLIAVNVSNAPIRGIFSGIDESVQQIDVEFENRNVNCVNGGFSDDFTPYAVHIYKI